MELSLRAEDSERRTRNAWTVMTLANVRIALHCDTDAVLSDVGGPRPTDLTL